MLVRRDPGACPICGAAHTACTVGDGPIAVAQMPARDAAALSSDTPSEARALGDGADGQAFSTATYRGAKKRR